MPIANHFERKSPTALATGCLRLTSGAAHAPRCLRRKPTFVANAQKRARRIPSESKSLSKGSGTRDGSRALFPHRYFELSAGRPPVLKDLLSKDESSSTYWLPL